MLGVDAKQICIGFDLTVVTLLRAVTQDQLPDVEVSATPYGLTAQQQKVIRDLYYGDFHYAGRDRLWELLKERARKDGKLEETVMKRKDGEQHGH